jgi:ATP-dependent helicase/nuclease subunit B
VVERLDQSLTQQGASLVVPVTRNKTPGELRSSQSVVTDRQFDLLRGYARDRMRRIAGGILSGQILPKPSRKDPGTSACTWCPYRDVCRFDPRAKDMAYRDREKRSSQENWEIIGKAMEKEGSTDA